METIGVLITYPVNSYLEKQLHNRFNLHRMWNFTHTDELIKHHSGSIRAIVTCPYFNTDREFIDLFPALEIVMTFSVGLNHVDLAYCKQKGIRVMNTPEVDDVADIAIGMILTLLRRINESERFVKNGLWKKCGFSKLTTKPTEQ